MSEELSDNIKSAIQTIKDGHNHSVARSNSSLLHLYHMWKNDALKQEAEIETRKQRAVKDADEILELKAEIERLKEVIDKRMQKAWDKMGDTGNDDYATDKMNWNEENFWFGYFRALEELDSQLTKES